MQRCGSQVLAVTITRKRIKAQTQTHPTLTPAPIAVEPGGGPWVKAPDCTTLVVASGYRRQRRDPPGMGSRHPPHSTRGQCSETNMTQSQRGHRPLWETWGIFHGQGYTASPRYRKSQQCRWEKTKTCATAPFAGTSKTPSNYASDAKRFRQEMWKKNSLRWRHCKLGEKGELPRISMRNGL